MTKRTKRMIQTDPVTPATLKSRVMDNLHGKTFEDLTTDELIDAICEDRDLWFVRFIDDSPNSHVVDADFD